jgi:hypothetical protein
MQLPPFWPEWPAVFAQADAQFSLAGINNKKTKFCCMISQLDHQYVTEVEGIITSPPQKDPYTMLRTKLVNWLPPRQSSAFTNS